MMKILFLVVIQILGLFAWARIEVQTLPVVEVSLRDRVTLADILDYSFQDQELEKSLQNIVLRTLGGDEGSRLVLNREEVLVKYREALAQDSWLAQKNPLLILSDKTVVTFSNEVISKEELRRSLLRSLKEKCADCSFRIEFTSVPQPRSPNWSVNFEKVLSRGPFLLQVKDGDQDLYISGKIISYKKVFVTKRLIPIGIPIQAEDLEEKIIDLTNLREDPLDLKDIVGKKVSSIIAHGQPVMASQLKREYSAQRGLPIRAVIENEHISISYQLQAEENGYVGDVIKVKNVETQKISLGKIIEKGVVKVQ